MTKRISSQKEFAAIKPKFNSASDYPAFKKDCFFNPESRQKGIGRQQQALKSGLERP